VQVNGRQPSEGDPGSQWRALLGTQGFDRDHDPVEFGRVVALTDGVFAIAITLLVLNLTLPAASADEPLFTALADRGPQLLAFFVSVAVVGSFFISHHGLLAMFQRLDPAMLWLTVAYVGIIVLIPFMQGLLGDRGDPPAAALYAVVIGCAATVEALMLWHGKRCGLLRYPLHGRLARLEFARAVAPLVVWFASAGLAFVFGLWTIVVWFSVWPIDAWLVRLEQRSSS
jgi:uncharacterized membrane protein